METAVFFISDRTGKSILVKVLLLVKIELVALDAPDIMVVNAGKANVVTPDAGEPVVPCPNAEENVLLPVIDSSFGNETLIRFVQPVKAAWKG